MVFHHKFAPGELLGGDHTPVFAIDEVNLDSFFLPTFDQLVYSFPLFRLQLCFDLPGALSHRVDMLEFMVLLHSSLSFFLSGLLTLDGLFQSRLGDGCIGGNHKTRSEFLKDLLLQILGSKKVPGDLSCSL